MSPMTFPFRKESMVSRFPWISCLHGEPTLNDGDAMARRQVRIVNAHGLHMRPSDKFVRLANTFQSEIRVGYLGTVVDGKSILDMTCLAAECGKILDLEARGPDAEEAVAVLAELVEAGFHM
ncbi:hypothetical protein BH23PLA1_BH23PLA1_25210 [soil metagenome]